MSVTTQGAAAVGSGNMLEQVVVTTLRSKQFEIADYKMWQRVPGMFEKELLLTNVPYTSIYGHKSRSEFLLLSEKYNLQVRIECKWQQSKGSVDEKLPYLYLNCALQMPESTIFIVIDGGGFKAGAVSWIKGAASRGDLLDATQVKKDIRVMDLAGFIGWANRELR